jgi:hypothetical protein
MLFCCAVTENSRELQGQLAELSEYFGRLGTNLLETSQAMREGAPPAEALVRQLTALRGAFVDLRTRLIQQAGSFGVTVAQSPEAMLSLTDLEPLLRAIVDAETKPAPADARRAPTEPRRLEAEPRRAPAEPRRAPAEPRRAEAEPRRVATDDQRSRSAALDAAVQRAIGVLNRVLAIGHRDDSAFQPLLECQAKTSELRLALSRLAAENPDCSVEQVDEVMLPFADFLTLVIGRENLDDERWSQLEEGVGRIFGRPLAIAATRGRLFIQGLEPRVARPVTPSAPEAGPRAEPRPVPTAHMAPAATAPAAPPPAPPAPPPAVEPAAATFRPTHAEEPASAQAGPDPRAAAVPWWAATTEAWRAWKSSGMATAHALRAELAKHPYLLSVPIQQSVDYDEGRLAAGYFVFLDHVENQSPAFIRTALDQALEQAGESADPRALGTRLYVLMVTKGKLRQSYPNFVRDVMVAAIPNPGVWVDGGVIESDAETVVVTHPGHAIGETAEDKRSLTEQTERLAEHRFAVTVAPMTTRFFYVKRGELKAPRDVHVKLTLDGEPSDAAWLLTLRTDHLLHASPKRPGAEGASLEGLGQSYGGLWVAVFNVEPAGDKQYELVVSVRPQGPPAGARRASFGAPARPR